MTEPAYRYTKHQVARGTRADAQTETAYYLFKNVSVLHATYQIRLLTYFASKKGKKLIVQVPAHCRKSELLRQFIREHGKLIRIEVVK
jgi:hypothetical protein